MLKSVEIKNFRSCYDTSFQLEGNVCALTGRNGVGKSNVLKAIEWVCKSVSTFEGISAGPAGNYDEKLDEVSIRFQIEIEGLEYDYRLAVPSLDDRSRQLRESLDLIGADFQRHRLVERVGEHFKVGDNGELIRASRHVSAIAAWFALMSADHSALEHISGLLDFFRGATYYSLEESPIDQTFVMQHEFDDWKSRHSYRGDLTDSVVMRLVYMRQEEPESFDELAHLLGANGLDIVSEIYVMPDDGAMQPPSPPGPHQATGNKFYYVYITPPAHMGGAGKPYLFSELSVGTKRVIQIITSMLFDKRSLMLIEQPEDSIHPGLLEKVIGILRAYSHESQVLFTTHSPEVLDILEPDEILLTTAPEGRTQVRRLNPFEVERAKEFLKNEGSLSEFLEPLGNL